MIFLSGLAHQHCSNSKSHQKQSAKAVQQIHATLELVSVGVNNGHCHDGDKAIESVKCRKFHFLFVHNGNADCHLHKHCELSCTCVPPQGSSTKWLNLVRSQGPHTSESVGNNRDPRPRKMGVIQRRCCIKYRGGNHTINLVAKVQC